MKVKKTILSLLLVMILTSCATTSYFQVYKTETSDQLVQKDGLLVYEDENCKVSYNLWGEGGDIGFLFFNKTEKNIYLDMTESFFVLNGVAHNYYKNRVFTYSTSVGGAAYAGVGAKKAIAGLNQSDLIEQQQVAASKKMGITSSSGTSVSYNEEEKICIPPKSSKIVSEYIIKKTLFRDCDLDLYKSFFQSESILITPNESSSPKKKREQNFSKTFLKQESPLVFSNKIAYAVGKNKELMRIENKFYVTKISNHPEKDVIESRYEEFCGQKSQYKVNFFKNPSADSFYIKYNKGNRNSHWKH